MRRGCKAADPSFDKLLDERGRTTGLLKGIKELQPLSARTRPGEVSFLLGVTKEATRPGKDYMPVTKANPSQGGGAKPRIP